MTKHTQLVERYMIGFEQLLALERAILLQEHVKRYAIIRRFCYGKVLDFASGCGYGSFLIASNPDVTSVTGADIDAQSIDWANKEFRDKNKKLTYLNSGAEQVKEKYDTLVCIETIEHIKDKDVIPKLVKRCGIDNIIVSFPDKKTTHYNKHHMHDFVRQDIVDLFPDYLVYHFIRFTDCATILMTRLPAKAPHDLFRNIRDL